MKKTLPEEYGNVIVFTTLTGLRGSEALNSIRLIKTDLQNYEKEGILEHFRYPETFIRPTKKAFISIVWPGLVEIAKSCQDINYEGFSTYLKRRKYPTNLKYCRKIFGTYLRQNGIDTEIIDLLCGRVPNTIFGRHYYRPDFKQELERVKQCLGKLHNSVKE